MRVSTDKEGGALKSEGTSHTADDCQPPDAGQEIGNDEMLDLLIEALDGAAADPVRLSLMTRLVLFLHEPDREADLERLRQGANHTVTRP